jgi:hypothetical protein
VTAGLIAPSEQANRTVPPKRQKNAELTREHLTPDEVGGS